MTNEHLRPLLDSTRDGHLFFLAREQLARAHVPPSIITLIHIYGKMSTGLCTTFTKPRAENKVMH